MAKKIKEVNPNKKLLRIVFCIIFIPLVIYYSIKIYDAFGKENEKAYLDRIIGKVQYNELSDVFYETTRDYFLYISYTNYDDVNDLELELKKIIINYNLQDSMYYLDITEQLKNSAFITELNSTLKTNDIKEVPAIVYYEDGNIQHVITSKNGKVFSSKEFKNLLKKHEIIEEQ